MKIIKNIKNAFLKAVRFLNERKKLLLYTILILFLALNFVFSEYGIINRISLEFEKSELIDDIQSEKSVNDSLMKRINILKSDSIEIERLAREYYGMTKPNEKLFIYKKRIKNDED